MQSRNQHCQNYSFWVFVTYDQNIAACIVNINLVALLWQKQNLIFNECSLQNIDFGITICISK